MPRNKWKVLVRGTVCQRQRDRPVMLATTGNYYFPMEIIDKRAVRMSRVRFSLEKQESCLSCLFKFSRRAKF